MSNIPDIETALSRYSNQFEELEVEERTPIFDLNAVNPISSHRERWQNVTNEQSERRLSTSASTDDDAFLETIAHGEYAAGYQAQTGIGVRIPTLPTQNSEMRWGYYEVDANGDPLNGFYYGADSSGIFVARANDGTVEKVYQENWNRDKLLEDQALNPSGETLDITDGHVFQIEFVYYGYGSIEMQILMDQTEKGEPYTNSEMVTMHVFDVDEDTSIKQTGLPLRQEIVSNGTASDALDLFVGGRQYSIIGKESTNNRRTGHFLSSVSAIDDTKWHHAISFQVKDGTDIGSIDFSHLISEVLSFEADTDANAYRWQIRRGTTPDAPTWENPTSAEDNQDETALKVDTSSADVQDGSGNLTGVMLDGGVLSEGAKNEANVKDADVDGRFVNGQTVSLLFKAVPGASGTVSDIYFKAEERW